MKFFATALLLAATAMALPQPGGEGNIQSIPKDMTINQAQAKCGDNAKVNCCNKYTTNKNINTNNSGPLAGVAQSALAQGLGIGEQCNDLSVNGMTPCMKFIIMNMFSRSHSPCSQHCWRWCRPAYQPEVQAEHCLLPEHRVKRRMLLLAAYSAYKITH
jgi:hypothetical protein